MNKILSVFIYLSAWAIAWLLITFIIDKGLIQSGAYLPASKIQTNSYYITAIIFIGGALSLYKEVFDRSKQE